MLKMKLKTSILHIVDVPNQIPVNILGVYTNMSR